MKNHTPTTFPRARHAVLAALLVGASAAFAQTSTPSGTTGTSSTTDTTRRNNPPTAPADVEATREINAQTTASNREKLSWGDRRFVHKAADSGQEEIQLAQLAAQRATNPEVRTFAQKLVDDHSKVNSELTGIASQKGLNIEKDDDKTRAYKRLNKKSGAEFDQEFVEHMIDEHEKDVRTFEKAATDAKDPELRSFASKHVSHLRDHLRQAQNLQQSVMPTGRTDSSSGRSTPSTGTGTTTRDTSTYPSTSTGSTTTSGSKNPDSSSSSSDTTQPRKDR